jgi:hypothetical protein
MPWPCLCDSGYLSLGLLAKVFYKFDDCSFADVARRNSGHIFCTNPKTGHLSDFVSISIAGHRFLPYLYSINSGTIVKSYNRLKSDLFERQVNHTTDFSQALAVWRPVQ